MALSDWGKEMLGEKPSEVAVSGDTFHLLVDGDILAYRCAAATDGKYYEVTGRTSDGVAAEYTEVKYHRDVVITKMKWESDGLDVTVTPKWKAEPEFHATGNLEKLMNTVQKEVKEHYGRPIQCHVYLTSDVLFRDDISPTYKKSREGLRRPTHLKACKSWLVDNYSAEILPGYEADDLIAMKQTDVGRENAVVISIDKDLKQLEGHHYDFVQKDFVSMSMHEARLCFWTQVLVGDKTDDIPGLKGVGPVTAEKILKDLTEESSDYDFYTAIVHAYVKWTKREEDESDDAFATRCLKNIGRNARLLYLCREPERIWDAPLKDIGLEK